MRPRSGAVPGAQDPWGPLRVRLARTVGRVWLGVVVACAALGALEVGGGRLFELVLASAVVPAAAVAMVHDGFPVRAETWRALGLAAVGGVVGVHALVGLAWSGGAAPGLTAALVLTGAALAVEWLSRDRSGGASDADLRAAARGASDEELVEAWVRSAAELRTHAHPRDRAAVVRRRAALLDELLHRARQDDRPGAVSLGGFPDDPLAGDRDA